MKPKLLLSLALVLVSLANRATSAPAFDTSNPLSFFTNVANGLLSSEMNLSLTQIQIYPTNQYTPAVHRLLQVTANIYDATSTNLYPSVFRPVFNVVQNGTNQELFIAGYTYVSTVNGAGDANYFSPPYDAAYVASVVTGSVATNVNIYNVPWIIGAKKGLPNFNQFSIANIVSVTRKLQVSRPSLNSLPTATNQMYVFSISNVLGCSLWNSYTSNYNGNLTVFAQDNLVGLLTNDDRGFIPLAMLNTNVSFSNFTVWPGADLRAGPPNITDIAMQPDITNSFVIPLNTSTVLLTNGIYRFYQSGYGLPWPHLFDGDMTGWQTTGPCANTPPLPQFGLSLTNQLQVFILDSNHVIDYVHFSMPVTSENINKDLADPDSNNGQPAYMWSTNLVGGVPSGVINQIDVSRGTATPAPNIPEFWGASLEYPPLAMQAFFSGAFRVGGAFLYNNKVYYNTNLVNTAPYIPMRILYNLTTWQANDPLVHYLVSDLKYSVPYNVGWQKMDQPFVVLQGVLPLNLDMDPTIFTLSRIHYTPWGSWGWLNTYYTNVDQNPYNSEYKDPSAWRSDYWDFPTNQSWDLNWLGRVHRGTPWQTIYLKSSNILTNSTSGVGVGLNTWSLWEGVTNSVDIQLTAPINDWQLVSVLAAMLNTNDLSTQFSINNANPNAWAGMLDGLVVLTNSASSLVPITVSSNSTAASLVVGAILAQGGSNFQNVGGIMAVPQLSEQSPFLDWNNTNAITDEAYEALPSQILPWLRVDSVGAINTGNGQMQIQFSGYDRHSYAVQVSSDLVNWTSISTNSPFGGKFSLPVSTAGNSTALFYRSLLIQ